eukprot:9602561-Karenia_brevis.AAC.1
MATMFLEKAQRGYKADEACIALDEISQTLRVMLQASDASSVEYRHLSPADKKIFDAARNKEIQGLLHLGACRLMSLKESIAFRQNNPDYVLPSRW